jgi:hypothetical protein
MCWQQVEIGKGLGELAIAPRGFVFVRRYQLKAADDRPQHGDVNRLAGTFRELPDEATGFLVLNDHCHRSTRCLSETNVSQDKIVP